MLEPLEARLPVRAPRLERIATPVADAPFAAAVADHAGPLLQRLLGAVSANVVRLVDRLEDPARMLRLSRFELEGSLIAISRALRTAAADLAAADRAITDALASGHGWDAKADTALAHGREDLARLAIAERLRAADRVEALTRRRDTLAARRADLDAEALRLRSAIGEVWTRQRALADQFGDHSSAPDETAIDAALDHFKAARLSRPN